MIFVRYRKNYDRKVAHKPNTLLFKKPAVKYSKLVIYRVAPLTELWSVFERSLLLQSLGFKRSSF